MPGGFDRKPGGTSLVQDAADGGRAPGPGKRTLTDRLSADGGFDGVLDRKLSSRSCGRQVR